MDEKLSIPRNLVTERKHPYDQIPLSMDARLLWVAEPRLSVNRMISGTRTYARTLLNGSHSMLPYSFTRTHGTHGLSLQGYLGQLDCLLL